MTNQRVRSSSILLSYCLVVALFGTALPAHIASAQSPGDKVLHPADLEAVIPGSVFFRGQSAPVQLRNAGGVKFGDGFYFFAALVDTSGYSTGVQAKYQAYLVAEVPLTIGGHDLAPGAYGVGFTADNKFLVMDIGAHDLFTVASKRDDEFHRPTPLQVVAEDKANGYRLYEGRNFVTVARTPGH